MALGWRLIRIDGTSMEPVLRHGDYAVAWDCGARRMPTRGDIVLVDHPRFGRVVKAVAARTPDGEWLLRGLSATSTPGNDLGPVSGDRVVARLVWRIGPEGGVERLPRRRPDLPASPA